MRYLIGLLSLLISSAVIAGESQKNSWQYRLTPYGWFSGLKGDISTIPGAPIAPIDVSSKEALEDSELALFALFEAKYERKYGLLIDVNYSDVRSEDTLIEAIGLNLGSVSKSTMLSTAFLYQWLEQDNTIVDLHAGARYWKIDTTLGFSGGLGILEGQTITHKESWVDPMIGIKARTYLADSSIYIAGGASFGGFGVGSDSFYDINANIGYQWSKAIGTSIGYRLFDLDYQEDGFHYDVKQEGWLIGLTWSF